MDPKTCPRCNQISSASAVKCDCGFNFESGRLDEATSTPMGPRETFCGERTVKVPRAGAFGLSFRQSAFVALILAAGVLVAYQMLLAPRHRWEEHTARGEAAYQQGRHAEAERWWRDRKSTRLNSSH